MLADLERFASIVCERRGARPVKLALLLGVSRTWRYCVLRQLFFEKFSKNFGYLDLSVRRIAHRRHGC